MSRSGTPRRSSAQLCRTSGHRRHVGETFAPLARQLRVEALEDRRMLAVFSVTNLDDAGAGSLRDAISMANSSVGADEIQFSVTGDLALTSGHIEITETLTITGPGQDVLTLDAQLQSRIFNITATTGDFTLAGLTLIGGQLTGDNADASDSTFSGGAVRSLTSGNLTIDHSTVSGNSTAGNYADGGGILSVGDVTLTSSTISGNITAGDNASGGGIFSYGDVTLTLSTVTDNHVSYNNSTGGGIWNEDDTIVITNSIVAGNTAGGGMPDIRPGTGSLNVDFSLIEDTTGLTIIGMNNTT